MSPLRLCCRFMVLAVVAVVVYPAPASACDLGYRPLPELFKASTDVFVGTVTESVFARGADGQIAPRPGGAALDFRFKVLARYKGAANTPSNLYEMVLAPGRYRLGIRQNGTQIGDAVTLTVANGESRRVNLGPGWPR